MPLTLSVDAERWRAHHRATLASYAGLVPVAKGNGYGFGNARLAAEASHLGVAMLAVGTYEELPTVAKEFGGDLLVLTPWRPFVREQANPTNPTNPASPGDPADPANPGDRLVHTVSRLEDLRDLADGAAGARPRIVVELLTSMRRHGLRSTDLTELAALLDRVQFEGWAMHLPLPASGTHLPEVIDLLARVEAAGLPAERLYVSHLSSAELGELGAKRPHLQVHPRVGTTLWLGDRSAYHATATVLDVQPVRKGEQFGYRQRRVPGDGSLVVVAGGTAHGIALEAPSHVGSLRERAKTFAQGAMEASGKALSPFSIGGQRRWFAEPPHMQVSLVFVPASVPAPAVGDQLEVNVGMTLTAFDEVVVD